MKTLLPFACIYILLIAPTGFLMGQLFFGHFSIAASLAGSAGLICAFAGFGVIGGAIKARSIAFWSGLFALIGVAFDAADYYLNYAIPGNYYAWGLIGPYCCAIIFVAYVSRSLMVVK
ncbi:MAG TPA: hypothetical protein PKD88_01320 [Nitrosomonas sp.]|nr:hypothetical protein [Nitrosomonas sp.]HMW19628.1 hypothetical protein [Nitrosomonas sp.]HMW68437.1 hypothetical protein [Nitrosomonas sp.]HMY60955.1 hypothetical protein [Nitrosomonas sp.]HMY90841.1 hypothetical protein [Nitrosomonas sp.]